MHVLLLDEGFMSGALAAAGLRDAGCLVTVMAAIGGGAAHRADGITWRSGPTPGDARFLEAVGRLVQATACDRVVALTEPIRDALWRAAPPWAARVHECVPPTSRPLLASKRALLERAGTAGIAVPRQRAIRPGHEGDDVDAAIAALGLPLVVKGDSGRGGCATRIVATRAAAREAAGALAARTACVAQELVDGRTWLAGGVFDGGRALRLYLGEKLELHPARTGPSVVIRSAREPALERAARATFALLRLTGIASADFIRAPDGRFLLLEVNPRPWGSIAAAADAGVALFPAFAELLAGGHPAADTTFREGVTTRVFPLYLASRAHWHGLRALREAADDLRGPQGALWREPAQALHLVRRLLGVKRNWPADASRARRPAVPYP